MIDDVVAVLWPEHDRDHVLAEKLLSLHFALGTPAFALLLDLPNADRHLGRAQVCDNRKPVARSKSGNGVSLRTRLSAGASSNLKSVMALVTFLSEAQRSHI